MTFFLEMFSDGTGFWSVRHAAVRKFNTRTGKYGRCSWSQGMTHSKQIPSKCWAIVERNQDLYVDQGVKQSGVHSGERGGQAIGRN
jgi:hypothetical protein